MTDTVEPAALALIIKFEESGSFSPKPYRDPGGIPTQGYGSIWNWRTKPRVRVAMGDAPVDEQTARTWLGLELTDVLHSIAINVKVPLTSNEKAGLEDFIYNLGSGNFASSTLLRKLNAGDYQGAADEFPKWDMQNGVVLRGLMLRRAADRAEFLKGSSAPVANHSQVEVQAQAAVAAPAEDEDSADALDVKYNPDVVWK